MGPLQREGSPLPTAGTPDLPQVQLVREVLGKSPATQGLQAPGGAPGGTSNRLLEQRATRTTGNAGGLSAGGNLGGGAAGIITSAAAALSAAAAATPSTTPAGNAGVIRSSRGNRRSETAGDRASTPGVPSGVGRPLTTRPGSSMKNKWTSAPATSGEQETPEVAGTPATPAVASSPACASATAEPGVAITTIVEAVPGEGSATAVRAGSSPATCQTTGAPGRLRCKSRSNTRPHSAQVGAVAVTAPLGEDHVPAEAAARAEAGGPSSNSSAAGSRTASGSRAASSGAVANGTGLGGASNATHNLPAGAGAVAARAAPRSGQNAQKNIVQGFEAPSATSRQQPGIEAPGFSGSGDAVALESDKGSGELTRAASPPDGSESGGEEAKSKPLATASVAFDLAAEADEHAEGPTNSSHEHRVPTGRAALPERPPRGSSERPPATKSPLLRPAEPPTPPLLPSPSPPSSTPPSVSEQLETAQPSKSRSSAKRSRSMDAAARRSDPAAHRQSAAGSGEQVITSAQSASHPPAPPRSASRLPGASAQAEASLSQREDVPESTSTLIGAEDLPVIGAAGVLVLPKRPGFNCANADKEDAWLFTADQLSGWGLDCEREDLANPERLMDAARRDKVLAEYAANDPSVLTSDASEVVPSKQELLAVNEGQAPSPVQGPSLLQLLVDPKRREECPVCAAEWRRVVKELGSTTVSKETVEAVPAPIRRRTAAGKVKMHSVRCAWAWFQQNLSASLCGLRFDSQGVAVLHPPPASRVLPPPIMDIWNYWRQKGGRSEKTDRANVSERLTRGESAV
mmetsp:Transcript_66805/g.110591  ORF Transcript_66805/g.110591 Transcript_66805/m.110591 type:complete len:802 (+) Transcript_66805:609-3014(+)